MSDIRIVIKWTEPEGTEIVEGPLEGPFRYAYGLEYIPSKDHPIGHFIQSIRSDVSYDYDVVGSYLKLHFASSASVLEVTVVEDRSEPDEKE